MERISQDSESGILLERDLILRVFSEMHVELGCRLMDYWNIPPVYRSIVAEHHSELVNPDDTLLSIVRLVNINSRRLHQSLNPSDFHTDDVLSESSTLRMDDSVWANLEEAMIGAGKTGQGHHTLSGTVSQ
jgi:hypothetical protein